MSVIEQEEFYPHPPERVWRALTDADAISAWLMDNDFEPLVGRRFEFHTKPTAGPDSVVACEVVELDEQRRLAYSWQGGGFDTMVTWTLMPSPGGTTLRLEHAGFDGVRGYFLGSMLAKGWEKMANGSFVAVLDQLAAGVTIRRTTEHDSEHLTV